MSTYQHIQYIELPPIPNIIVENFPKDVTQYNGIVHGSNYKWTDEFTKELNAWAQKNICSTMYWALQFMTADIAKHKDRDTKIKINYVIDAGGSDVHTQFWDDTDTLINDYVVPVNKWHLFKADTLHSVQGIEQNKSRWAVTGRVF